MTNRDRAVGARLGGAIAARHGAGPLPGRVRVELTGSAGQSFGAFLARGSRLVLVGDANDGVGKSMAGGRIAVRPPADDDGDPVLVGNAALYGATGGELFCAGRAGERFAVRNSGAVAVVEGLGAHGCEYMTAGRVVVLGEIGRNLAAGMSGGELFVHDPAGVVAARLNHELVAATEVDGAAAERLRELLEPPRPLHGLDARCGAARALAGCRGRVRPGDAVRARRRRRDIGALVGGRLTRDYPVGSGAAVAATLVAGAERCACARPRWPCDSVP